MQNTETIQISSIGIRNSLKKYKPLQSIAEYVWNGFDAKATAVSINIKLNPMGCISSISIADNGTGIARNSLSTKFKPFFQSEKEYDPEIKHSETHGKNGVGRLTFFSFASNAEWETLFNENDEIHKYIISIDAVHLHTYSPSEILKTQGSTGTTVIISNVFDKELNEANIRNYLAVEFCWFLELHKNDNFLIILNGISISYESSISTSRVTTFINEKTGTNFEVKLICWNQKLTEYSKYYYICSDGTELTKENTTLNNKGDDFYHSVFIKSSLFDNFDMANDIPERAQRLDGVKDKRDPDYKFVMHKVNQMLVDERRPFLKSHVDKVLADMEIESAFPHFDKNNPMDSFKKREIELLISSIYVAQPKVFTSLNREQKRTFIRLLDLTLQSGEVGTLYEILKEILEMDASQREDFAGVLRLTRMSNITKTLTLISDRYKAIDELQALVYNKDLNANEVDNLQKMIEKHYWIFGEQFNLVTAAEPPFEEALRRYLHYLHEEYSDAKIEHPDKLKQMDIFAVRQDYNCNKIDNIVVELKHPNIALGEDQLSQVKKYMSVVMSTPQFNASNITWKFYLVGNKFNQNKYIQNELANNKHHGEPSLVFSVDNYKIYVKTWSEIFADFEMRYSHINKVLELKRGELQKHFFTADEVISEQKNSSAVMPPEMIPCNR